MFKRVFFILIAILLLFIGCQKDKVEKVGAFRQLDKIKLEKPMAITSLVFADNKIIAFNQSDKTIYMLNYEGRIVDEYKKIGKGPGEYTRVRGVNLIGYSKFLYLIEGMTNKIMKFKISDKFEFADEYYIEDSQVSPVGFIDDNENIYLSTMISDHVILKVNPEGKITGRYIKKEKESFRDMSAEQIKNYLVSNLYYPIIKNNRMVLTGFLSRKLKFYKYENDKFKLLKENSIKGLKGDVYKSETKSSKNKRQVSIEGIGYIGSWIIGNEYMVGVSKEELEESYINVFDLEGNFIGNIELEKYINKKYENMFYNRNKNLFYYQQGIRESKKDKYELNADYIFVGKMKFNK